MDDCEVVSRELSDILDEEDYIEGCLYSGGQFTGAWKTAEERTKILTEVWEKRWRSVLTGRSTVPKEFSGILKAYDKDSVTIEMEDAREQII